MDCEQLFRVQMATANRTAMAGFRKVRLKEKELAIVAARAKQKLRKKNREIAELKNQVKSLREELEVKNGVHNARVKEMEDEIRSLQKTKETSTGKKRKASRVEESGVSRAESTRVESPLTPVIKRSKIVEDWLTDNEESEALSINAKANPKMVTQHKTTRESNARPRFVAELVKLVKRGAIKCSAPVKIVDEISGKHKDAVSPANTSRNLESVPKRSVNTSTLSSDIKSNDSGKVTLESCSRVPRQDFEKSPSDSVATVQSETLAKKTFLEQCLTRFEDMNEKKRLELDEKLSEGLLEGYERDLFLNNLELQFGRLFKCSSDLEFESIVARLIQSDYSRDRESLLFAFMFDQLKKERDPEFRDRDLRFSDVAFRSGWAHPRLTPRQTKVFSLLVSLEGAGMPGLTDRAIEYLFHSILAAGRLEEMRLYEAVSMIRFYFTLLRMKGDDERVRTFLFDITFFGSPRKHVIVCVLLEVWPQVLRWPAKATAQTSAVDPVLESYLWMIFNTGPPLGHVDMMVTDARRLLRSKCKISSADENAVELVKRQTELVSSNIDKDPVLCDSATLGLFLLSKCKDYKWVHFNVVERLLELRNHSRAVPLLSWIVETIGLVSRTFSAEGRDKLLELFKPLPQLTADALTPEMEETCITALIRVGHHLQVQVADFLWRWSPKFPLQCELISNYVGTRGEKHARATISHHKRLARKEFMRQLEARKAEASSNQ